MKSVSRKRAAPTRRSSTGKKNAAGASLVSLPRLKELIELVGASDIGELEIAEAGVRVRIARETLVRPADAALPTPNGRNRPASGSQARASADVIDGAAPISPSEHVVRCPVLGTFYRSPAPDAPAFVNIGDAVQEGQSLGIVEAMKVFNQVEAERAGIVKQILAANGQAVEANQPLFVIG